MSHIPRKPRSKGRRAAAALSGLAALLLTSAGLATGAAASPHYSPAGWHQSPPNDDPVPGVDYSTGPTALQPPPISVLKSSSHLAPVSIFIAPKILAAGTPDQQGAEIIDNEGRPVFFQPIAAPSPRPTSASSSTAAGRSSLTTSARAPAAPATARVRA